MAGFLLLYEEGSAGISSWQPMLQHQAIIAVARAILTHGSSEVPELSNHLLFAPLNLDVLPLLAIAASDFADFAEPEAVERPRTPIALYDDGSWKDSPEETGEMHHLLHQSWFERLGLGLAGTIAKFQPENCVILGDPELIAARHGQLLSTFRRIVHFNHLITNAPGRRAGLPGQPIAADGLLENSIAEAIKSVDGEPTARESMWDTMLGEGTVPDLEPFVAFGPAIEMTVLRDDGDR
jgi:hypothetical protein